VPIKLLPTVTHPYTAWPLYFMEAGALSMCLVTYLALPRRAMAVWAATLAGVFVQSLSIWPTVIIKVRVDFGGFFFFFFFWAVFFFFFFCAVSFFFSFFFDFLRHPFTLPPPTPTALFILQIKYNVKG
jgi:hypothetical protein